MMLCEIVSHIVFSSYLINDKLSLSYFVPVPIKTHIFCTGSALYDIVIHKTVTFLSVCKLWGGFLYVYYLGEGYMHGFPLSAIDKQGTQFYLYSTGEDVLHCGKL